MKNCLRKLIENFSLLLAMFLLPLNGTRVNFNFLELFKQFTGAHGVGRVVGALGSEAGFAGSMLN